MVSTSKNYPDKNKIMHGVRLQQHHSTLLDVCRSNLINIKNYILPKIFSSCDSVNFGCKEMHQSVHKPIHVFPHLQGKENFSMSESSSRRRSNSGNKGRSSGASNGSEGKRSDGSGGGHRQKGKVRREYMCSDDLVLDFVHCCLHYFHKRQ